MKKQILSLLVMLLLVPITIQADSYTSLWKKYTVFAQKDLPKSSIEILNQIISKSTIEKEYGHLLKAQLLKATVQTNVSPDSLQIEVERLTAQELKTRDVNPVLAAVYQTILGRIYRDNEQLGKDHNQKSKDFFSMALHDPDLLSAKLSEEFSPFVISGVDSRIFNYDLLHVIGLEAREYSKLQTYYQSHENRPAACICAALTLQQNRDEDDLRVKKSRFLHQVDSLINEYQDLPQAGELAVEHYRFLERSSDATTEDKIKYINYALSKWGIWPRMNILRNAQSDLTQPSFNVSIGDEMSMPHQPRKVLINSIRNISALTLKVWRLTVAGDTKLNPADEKDYTRLMSTAIPVTEATQTKRYFGIPACKVVTDSMTITGLPIGVYLVEFTTDNSNITPQRALLHVSDVFVVHQQFADNTVMFQAVSATTGKPLPNVTIRLTMTESYYSNVTTSTELVECDKSGRAEYNFKDRQPTLIYAYTDNDKAYPELYFNSNFSYYNDQQNRKEVSLFTDRKLYRPGQTVHVAALAYTNLKHEDIHPDGNQSVLFTLRDANGKVVAEKRDITDRYGSAAVDFVLPSAGLTGQFSIRCDYGTSDMTFFSVEEYKRPTFQVEFDPVQQKYQDGDSVTVIGHAKSFAGVPTQGALVKYVVTRRPAMWWWYRARKDRDFIIARDSVVTGSDGLFKISFMMELPNAALHDVTPRFYQFDIQTEITDVAGETQHGECMLPLSTKPTALDCDIPEKVERDSLVSLSFSYKNNAGANIAGRVRYSFDDNFVKNMADANKQLDIAPLVSSLSSGKHYLYAICGNDTIRKEFVLFTMNDKHPAISTHDWFYQSATEFSTKGKPVYIQVGSSDEDQYVFYTIHSGRKLIEKGVIEQSNAVKTRKFNYKDEYGDGLLLNYTWVRSGKMYSHQAKIIKPLPDKWLIATWTTFRDRLTPGQSEEWTLNISSPSGKGVKAQLMATMFDMSLDKIRRHSWTFAPYLYCSLPQTSWLGGNFQPVGFYGFMSYKPLLENALDFSHFYEATFPTFPSVMFSVRGMKGTRAVPQVMMAKTEMGSMVTDNQLEAVNVNTRTTEDRSSNQVSSSSDQVRENLNETAFFYPRLMSDDNGNVKIKFVLPESITTWRFIGLAHDSLLNHGILEGQSIAKKDVMIQPNMPRFLRATDCATIAARVFNSSETRKDGSVLLQLIDPETEQTVKEYSKPFSVESNQTAAVTFNLDGSQLPSIDTGTSLYICRMIASGRNFSDGEQHYLAFLPDKEFVTTSMPITQNTPGIKSVDIFKLFPVRNKSNKLTVEYTNNPAWLVIQALPTVAQTSEKNAISLAAAFYANSISRFIMNQTPSIKRVVNSWKQETSNESSLLSNLQKNEELKTLILDETPWVQESTRETDQKQQLINFFDESSTTYRIDSQLSLLQSLQAQDGSFSWWPGMPGSMYMTTAVVKMLVRLNQMIGIQPATGPMISSAFNFMDRRIEEMVIEMKKQERKGIKNLHPDDTSCDYLYISALAGKTSTADIHYLISLLEKDPSSLSIYGKANTAVILSKYGKVAKAKEYLQSLSEYTVYREDLGRYYDTPKAQQSWFDYRIPTQVAAIEALKNLQPDSLEYINEMQRWLLQEKRTQSWETPINSAEAAYAFLDGRHPTDLSKKENAIIRIDGKPMELSSATAGLGYVKGSVSGTNMKSVTIDKSSAGTSWGGIYAQYFQEASKVSDHAAGFAVTREIEGPSTLKVGDRVKVIITIRADRDYDFVQVVDKRAACLEPLQQLSGYRNGYYCSPRDHSTNYYFDRLSKGKHVIETEYYVDRSGKYQTGTCTVQCAYSPEFMARAAAKQLEVK